MLKQRIISWNVNGIRAVDKKNFKESLDKFETDILCLQETKAQDDQVAEVLKKYNEEYKFYSNSAEKKGYSGTAILSVNKPTSIKPNIGIDEHDTEGRVLTVEYDDFFLINVYVPNSSRGLGRLSYRQKWDIDFLNYFKKLEKSKPVIACGDFNVAHHPIDLAHPKENYNKTAGYTQIEIDGMDNFQQAGFTDTFRHLHPKAVEYSWWSYMFNSRERNIGWRIDYFLVSNSILKNVKKAFILPEVLGSDHCPVGIEVEF